MGGELSVVDPDDFLLDLIPKGSKVREDITHTLPVEQETTVASCVKLRQELKAMCADKMLLPTDNCFCEYWVGHVLPGQGLPQPLVVVLCLKACIRYS